jgi:hypothetical protein
MTVRRAVATTNASIHGVPIAAVDFTARFQLLCNADQHPQDSP